MLIDEFALLNAIVSATASIETLTVELALLNNAFEVPIFE